MKRIKIHCLSPLFVVLLLAKPSSSRLTATSNSNWASITHTQIFTNESQLVPDNQHNCQSGIISNDGSVCCDTSCGTCGGAGCENRPGGGSGCCTSNIAASGVVCSEEIDTRCNTVGNSTDEEDWASSWNVSRVLLLSGHADPYDSRSTKKGSGSIEISEGIAMVTGSPRLYISKTPSTLAGWENIDMSAYGKVVREDSSYPKEAFRFAFGARSNHGSYLDNECDAFGYRADIYWQTGELSFSKEYFHPSSGGGGDMYALPNSVDYVLGGFPPDKWIGMRFMVTTNDNEVELKLYLDEVGDGNWLLRHSMIDRPGEWNATAIVPKECPQRNGDPVLRAGKECFFRSDGSNQTEVHWMNATILNI